MPCARAPIKTDDDDDHRTANLIGEWNQKPSRGVEASKDNKRGKTIISSHEMTYTEDNLVATTIVSIIF